MNSTLVIIKLIPGYAYQGVTDYSFDFSSKALDRSQLRYNAWK